MSTEYCWHCGRAINLTTHHNRHKGMGGRHGEAKREIEDPSNKGELCEVCHGAAHGIRVIALDGFCCRLCPYKSSCEWAHL